MSTYSTKAISGIVLFIGGLLCFMFPVMGVLNVEAMLGIIALMAGIFHLVGSVEQKGEQDYTWGILNSVAYLAFGLFLLADPYKGVVLMSFIISLFLLSHGLFTLGAALSQKTNQPKWFWTLFSSGICLTLAVMVFFGINSPWTLAMLVGVGVLGYGMSVLVTAGVMDEPQVAKKKKISPAAVATKKKSPQKKAGVKKAAVKKTTAKKTASSAKKKK